MSNTIEFREVQRRVPSNGGAYTEETWWEYRTKDTIISLLGVVTLSEWSSWEKVGTIRVDQNGNPL